MTIDMATPAANTARVTADDARIDQLKERLCSTRQDLDSRASGSWRADRRSRAGSFLRCTYYFWQGGLMESIHNQSEICAGGNLR